MASPYFDGSSVAQEWEERIGSELESDERLLWIGQPRPGRYAKRYWPVMIFGIFFTAFSLFWVSMALGLWTGQGNVPNAPRVGVQLCFPLFGVPFVLVGLGLLTSPFWSRQQALRTCYALTDRRAIIFEVSFFGTISVRSYEPAALHKLHRTEGRDGCGDLVFEELVTMYGKNGGSIRTTQRGFMAIERVREVEILMKKMVLERT